MSTEDRAVGTISGDFDFSPYVDLGSGRASQRGPQEAPAISSLEDLEALFPIPRNPEPWADLRNDYKRGDLPHADLKKPDVGVSLGYLIALANPLRLQAGREPLRGGGHTGATYRRYQEYLPEVIAYVRSQRLGHKNYKSIPNYRYVVLVEEAYRVTERLSTLPDVQETSSFPLTNLTSFTTPQLEELAHQVNPGGILHNKITALIVVKKAAQVRDLKAQHLLDDASRWNVYLPPNIAIPQQQEKTPVLKPEVTPVDLRDVSLATLEAWMNRLPSGNPLRQRLRWVLEARLARVGGDRGLYDAIKNWEVNVPADWLTSEKQKGEER